MEAKPIIAFDFDGIFVDKPPLIPKKLIEFLFRGCRTKKLCFRFPDSKPEQIIRQMSHFYLMRPPIGQNIRKINKLAERKQYQLFLITSRYSFLEKQTFTWLKKRKMNRLFEKVIINEQNKQPHLFKLEMLKKIKPKYYFEDDRLIVNFLSKKLTKTAIVFVKQKNMQIRFLL